MAQVVVVGGGFAGMAVAVRLAKLGHRVCLCERGDRLGGAVRAIEQNGFRWDGGPAWTTLPAVVRDLFRKSGRPLERVLDLQPAVPVRRHHFADGTVLDLPTTGRGAQADAIGGALSSRSAQEWTRLVDGLDVVWDVARRRLFEVPFRPGRRLDAELRRALRPRQSLSRLASRSLRDERLRALLSSPVVLAGSDPRTTPGFCAVEAYVERTFGLWAAEGGMWPLADALATRLDERRVEVRRGAEVVAVSLSNGTLNGVQLASGDRLPADIVVCAVDPRILLSPHLPLRDTAPAIPPGVTHLGLTSDAPVLPEETVWHSDPLLVVRTTGSAQPGHVAWTVLHRGGGDAVSELAGRGLDVRASVVTRIDRPPASIVAESGGSPFGTAWRGARTLLDRPSNATPITGLFCVGATAHPGAGLPYVGLGAATVASLVGKA